MTPIFKLEANKTMEDGDILLVREQEVIKTGCLTLLISSTDSHFSPDFVSMQGRNM